MKAEPLSPVLQTPWNNGGPYRKHSNSVSSRNGSFHSKYQGYHRSRSPSNSPPRGRKGLPVFKNLSWVRPPTPPKEATTTAPNVSLLARIEPASDSLLHRLNLSDPAEASTSTSDPSTSVPKPVRPQTAQEIEAEAFAEMLIRESEAVMIRQAQEKLEAESSECHPKPEESEDVAPLAASNDVSTVSMHVEDTAIEAKPPPRLSPEEVPTASTEADNKSDLSLPINDQPLRAASPRQPDEKPVDFTATDTPISKDIPQNKTYTSPSWGSRQPELVEQARRLFLSIIVKKVQYHAPQATIQKIEEKALPLLTDDRCSELMKLAMDAKEQMRSRSKRGASQEREREREGDQAPARRDSRGRKRPHSTDHIRNHTRGGDKPDDISYWERGSWSSHARGDRSYGSRERGRDLTRPASDERFHGRNPVRGRSRESRIDECRPVTREPSLRDNMRDDSHIEPVEKGMPKKARRSRSRSPPEGVSRPTKRARSKSPVLSALQPSRSPISEVARMDKKDDMVVPRTPSRSAVTPPPTKKATPKMPKAMRVGLSTPAIESSLSGTSAASVASGQGAPVSEDHVESNETELGLSGAPEMHVDVADQPMTNQDESKSTGADVDDHDPGQPEVVVTASEAELAAVLLGDAEKECLRSSPMDISDLPPSDDVPPVATIELAQPMVVEPVQRAETSLPLETEKVTEKPTLISSDEMIPEELGTEPQTLNPLSVAESSNLITPPVPDVEMTTLEEEDVRSSPQPEPEPVVVVPQETQPQGDDGHEELTVYDEVQAEEEMQIDSHVDEENAVPSVPEGNTEISSEVAEQDTSSNHRYTRPVPGFWFASVGKSNPDIVDNEFYVDEELASAALRWGRRDISFESSIHPHYYHYRYHRSVSESANERRHIALYLLCLPVEEVNAVNEKLDRMATPERVTEAMCTIGTQWPKKGKLIVQFNEGDDNEKTWMPLEFKPGEPLEVSGYIQPGLNKARMIQLDRMDDRIFILYATHVSKEDQQEYAGRTSTSEKNGRQVPSRKGKERQRNTPEADGT